MKTNTSKDDTRIELQDIEALNLSMRQDLNVEELMALDDPSVLYEGSRKDPEGGPDNHIFTVIGFRNGAAIGDIRGGCTVGGEVIVINSVTDHREARLMAYDGLLETIKLAREEYLKNGGVEVANSGIITETGGIMPPVEMSPLGHEMARIFAGEAARKH